MSRRYATALVLLLAWLPAAVFAQTISVFSQQGPKLVGTGGVGITDQGYAMALSADGNTLAVGGHSDNNYIGATWIFTRSGANWSQQGPKLVGTGTSNSPEQGVSIALSADGNTLAVGGYNRDRTGATWIFTRSGANWSQQGPKLVGTGAVYALASLSTPSYAVALSADGNTLAMGGRDDNDGTGATWIFTRSGANWSQQGLKLVGTGAQPIRVHQGDAVALSADGNTLAVGGSEDFSPGAPFVYTGATWIFTRTGTSWSQQGPKLVGAGAVGPSETRQGGAVALSADGNTLAVGGRNDNSGLGATWVFTRTGANWSQQGAKLVGTGVVGNGVGGTNNIFQGGAVALSADGNTLATGGRGDNSNRGATWVFTRNGPNWSQQGAKLVGTGVVGPYGALQGGAVALSADGTTLATGGYADNRETGATWVFSTAGSPLAQRAAAGPHASTRFFPNPVTKHLTVTGGASRGTLRLIDSTGRIRLTAAYRDGQPLDLSALPAGFYWLLLDQGPARPLLKR